ncbi:MAG: T9SS type A sorting domain-containing protein [Bacteroidia bacterium]|nr:T9SS type A sorting domain-containing protein [Bacteroidia bacterium]MDW8348032.1 T9SS type A sorting domain-containing protein [Bacteroidia bacterium]
MKKLLYFFILWISVNYSYAQLTALGDIMFVGMNADGVDGVAFLALVDIPANTTIYFTDNEWTGTSFNTNESYFQWSHTVCVPAGTVVIVQNINQGTLSSTSLNPTANIGTVVWSTTSSPNNNSGIANSDECVYAYLGSSYNTPTTFLSAIANSSTYGGVITGTGLTVGSTFIEFTNNHDVFVYNSTNTCEATQAATLSKIANTTNWISQDGSGDQSNDGIYPDFPTHVITSFTGCYTVGCTFPIQLSYFTGIKLENTNFIQWQFENPELIKNVQLSVFDGKSDFIELYYSNFSFQNHYRHTLDTAGRYLYRLSWQDRNGTVYYSNVIEIIVLRENSSPTIFPNPAREKIWISGLSNNITIYQIYDTQGQRISEGTYSPSGIDLNGIGIGLYIIRCFSNKDNHTLLFTVTD